MKKIDRIMSHKDEYIMQQLIKHRGLIRSVLDLFEEEEENSDSGNTL